MTNVPFPKKERFDFRVPILELSDIGHANVLFVRILLVLRAKALTESS
jgi:hypothetical protein